jgi:hypothetical protein
MILWPLPFESPLPVHYILRGHDRVRQPRWMLRKPSGTLPAVRHGSSQDPAGIARVDTPDAGRRSLVLARKVKAAIAGPYERGTGRRKCSPDAER